MAKSTETTTETPEAEKKTRAPRKTSPLPIAIVLRDANGDPVALPEGHSVDVVSASRDSAKIVAVFQDASLQGKVSIVTYEDKADEDAQ